MSNYPILWQNCLAMFHTEIGRKAWIWFVETRGRGMQYEADKYALEVEKLVDNLTPMLKAGFKLHHNTDTETLSDLMRFILIRHANWRLGGNVIPAFLAGAS